MHDFLLAKEIIEEILKIAKKKNLDNVQSVDLEIGAISLAHDGGEKHIEDISPENLRFGLQSIAKNTNLINTQFNIKKVAGNNWRITNLKI